MRFNDHEDTLYLLHNKKYLVKVRNIETFSSSYLEEYGLPYTGVREIDSNYAKELIESYYTIAEMIIHYSTGGEVRIVHRDDIVEIYSILNNHIFNYRNFVANSIALTTVPEEDIDLMASFATALYEYLDDDEIPNYFEEPFSKLKVLNEETLFEKKETVQDSQTKLPPHLQFLEDAKEKLKYRRMQWTSSRNR